MFSLLVSRNMLPNTEPMENKVYGNGEVKETCNDAVFKTKVESYQHLENISYLKRGRQGEFKDVKSIIADFKQKNPNMLPSVSKIVITRRS